MYRHADQTQDLKLDILELKKELANVREENQLQKVKIRKLQNEISKRDRQIENLLDPRKSTFFKKTISERGAAMIMNLRDRNLKLEKILNEKESLIRRLQNDLQTKKLCTVYGRIGEKKKSFSRQVTGSKFSCTIPYYSVKESDSEKDEDETVTLIQNFKSASMQDISSIQTKTCSEDQLMQRSIVNRSHSADRSSHLERLTNNVQQIKQASNDMKSQYEGLSRDHLLSIIENLKANQQRHQCHSPLITKGESPESDLEHIELQCDTPHQEIAQLQNYFMDMINEVDSLKEIIGVLRSEHSKTVTALKEKENSITHLAEEVKNLKRPKSVNVFHVKDKSMSHNNVIRKPATLKKRTQSTLRSHTPYRSPKLELEETVNVCNYTEVEEIKTDKEREFVMPEIIQTRQINNQEVNKIHKPSSSPKQCSSKSEEEMRREKFKHLMDQIYRADRF